MNYITELNSFYDWLETNPLATSSIVLWHALMHIANKAGWPDKFAVAVSVLELKTGLKKDAIFDARHKLQQTGRIKWETRKGNQSALYEMVSLVSVKPTQLPMQYPTQTPTQLPTQSPTINKLNETKLNETAVVVNVPDKDQVLIAYQNNIGVINDISAKKLDTLTDKFTAEWMLAAIEEAVLSNARKLGFIESVLSNWGVNGFKTKPWEVEQHGRRDKSSYSGSNKQGQRGGRGSPAKPNVDWENEPDTL